MSIDADLESFHLRRALRTIDAEWEGSPERFWQRATALAGLERYRDAETAVVVIANEASLPADERARAAAKAVAYRSRVERPVDPLLVRLAGLTDVLVREGAFTLDELCDGSTARRCEQLGFV